MFGLAVDGESVEQKYPIPLWSPLLRKNEDSEPGVVRLRILTDQEE